MVNVFILALHLIFIIYIFLKKKAEESVSNGLINIALILILFSVGWSIISLLLNIFIEPEGFGKDFDRSTISLSILTIGEFFFYRSFFKDLFRTKKTENR